MTGPKNSLTKSTCNRDLVNDVPNSHLTASSSYTDANNYDNSPNRSRLHTQGVGMHILGAWCAGSVDPENEYIQARFYGIKEVFGVATQGRNGGTPTMYVSSYTVSFSTDCVTFALVRDSVNEPKVFPGNYDQDTVVQNDLPESLLALCVRINSVTVVVRPAMRFGVIGCDP